MYKELKHAFPDIKGHARIFGYDIELYSKTTEMLIQTIDDIEYNIDLAFEGSEENLLPILDNLKKELLSLNIPFDLTYFIEDNNGNQISQDFNYCTFNP